MKTTILAVCLAALALPALADGTAHGSSDADVLAASRAAAEAYADLSTAVAAGYEPLFDCTDAGEQGAMGQHYINPGYAGDGRVVVEEPDVIMYEPQPDGSMQLVALEYIVFQAQWDQDVPPELLGQAFQLKDHVGTHPVDPFYELHVWHWRDNPAGVNADYNAAVTCAHAG